MQNSNPTDCFFVAPFSLDGEQIGIGVVQLSDLSPKWLRVCEMLLASHGPAFRKSLGQMLAHVEIKLTSISGAGIGSFYAHNQLVVSTAYFRGQDSAAEQELERMFIDSLQSSETVQKAARTLQPFEALTEIKNRPLHVVVAWANPNATAEDQNLVRELANHFAAAYLCLQQG